MEVLRRIEFEKFLWLHSPILKLKGHKEDGTRLINQVKLTAIDYTSLELIARHNFLRSSIRKESHEL